jgi:hypothetical protein
MNKPFFFYKFVSFERKDILKNGKIRFTPIDEFNDPFELEPVINPLSREYLDYFANLTEKEKVTLKFSQKDYEYSIARSEKVNDYKTLYKERIGKYGVLSLSSNFEINPFLTVCVPEKKDPRTNILMWSHYADSHKGFIIEFDHDFIPGIELKKVEYSNKRDYLTFEDIEENNFQNVFLKKSNEWAYEQEYRVVLPLRKASEVKDDKFHLFEFNKKSVKSITFGCEMSQENKNIIMELIENDKEFDRVSFNHSRLNDDDFCLMFYHTSGGLTNNPDSSGDMDIPRQKNLNSK